MSGTAINNISFQEISITLWWKVENKSDIAFNISNQVYDVYLNGKLAKRIGNAPEIKVYPHSVARIPTNVVLNPKELLEIGIANIDSFLSKEKRNKITLEVIGNLTLKTSIFKMKDFPIEFKDTIGNIMNY
jgi:LEA14-like dessication related protein